LSHVPFSGACCIDRFPALNECSDSGVKETMDLERDVLSRRSAGSARATQNRRAIPPFLERISCLALIMGDSSLSKQGLGLGHRAKRREIFSDPRTNSGRDFRHVPDSRLGLIMGDFMIQKVSRQPLMRRENRSLRPPIF